MPSREAAETGPDQTEQSPRAAVCLSKGICEANERAWSHAETGSPFQKPQCPARDKMCALSALACAVQLCALPLTVGNKQPPLRTRVSGCSLRCARVHLQVPRHRDHLRPRPTAPSQAWLKLISPWQSAICTLQLRKWNGAAEGS
eukprot:2188252-Rhodomonas_salina.3